MIDQEKFATLFKEINRHLIEKTFSYLPTILNFIIELQKDILSLNTKFAENIALDNKNLENIKVVVETVKSLVETVKSLQERVSKLESENEAMRDYALEQSEND